MLTFFKTNAGPNPDFTCFVISICSHFIIITYLVAHGVGVSRIRIKPTTFPFDLKEELLKLDNLSCPQQMQIVCSLQ